MSNFPALELIRQFYVFNPDFGMKDGEEHKKLLFYHPKSDSFDTQIQNVGFCEAVVKFSDNFTEGQQQAAPFHEVQTEKEFHVYSCFEEKFLIGVTLSKTASTERKYFLHGKTLNNVLLRAYETFRLFFGTFNDVLKKSSNNESGGVNNLKERLDYFYTRYLMSLKLSSIPLLDSLEWISYMKLDPTNYLKVQTFADRIVEIFPSIRHTIFLYNDRLLLHNLSNSNLPCTYRYLVQNLLPISLRSELQPELGNIRMDSTLSHGKFITGPTTTTTTTTSASLTTDESKTNTTTSNLKLPSVFLLRADQDDDGEGGSRSSAECRLDEFYLIVYRALNATLAMLVSVDDCSSLDLDFFHNLDSAIGLQLTNLASNFVDLYGKEREESIGFNQTHQYIYYNSISLALTSTINEQSPFGGDGKSAISISSHGGIPLELAGVLCDFRDKITESDYFGDIVAKADGDYWIAAKKAGDRELYVVTYQKNANLTDVHEEIKRFCNSVFENVFLLE